MKDYRPIPGVDDAFGARAKALRELQGLLAGLFEQAGFEEVIPPIVERPQSLNSGAGRFLADQTLVFSDPADAGLLAIRPDMTPQVARIAATRLLDADELRLYYSGPVMLARPEGAGGSRELWQMGVECLGVPGEEGDAQVIELAARSMIEAGLNEPVIVLGHIGLVRALAAGARAPLEQWVAVLGRRSPDDLETMLQAEPELDAACAEALRRMASGRADFDWLDEQSERIGGAFAIAASELISLARRLKGTLPAGVELHVDAGVVPRYLYHSGAVFQGFACGCARILLHGGRYDAMMAAHGRDMPATGFSCDLWTWIDALGHTASVGR